MMKLQLQPGSRTLVLHSAITIGLAALTAGSHLRPEYLVITLFWGVLTLAGPRSRRLLGLATPILLVGILYDQILPRLSPYRGEVHVAELYRAEARLFGIVTANGLEIPSQWLARHTSPWLDLACGFVYLAFMVQLFAGVLWLYFVDGARATRLAWAFLICNLIGMACELLYPAAPPWYVARYGLGPAHLDAPASAAGAARFDALLGIDYFAAFYARSKDVFGAMPSLHVAYPVLVLMAVWRVRPRWVRGFALGFAALMAFAAVYLEHHYVLDVVGGTVDAVIAYQLCVGLGRRFRPKPMRASLRA